MMLFISILLSVWFVCWLVYAKTINDAAEFAAELLEEEEDMEENKHYHCENCGNDWWTTDFDAKYCPRCGERLKE